MLQELKSAAESGILPPAYPSGPGQTVLLRFSRSVSRPHYRGRIHNTGVSCFPSSIYGKRLKSGPWWRDGRAGPVVAPAALVHEVSIRSIKEEHDDIYTTPFLVALWHNLAPSCWDTPDSLAQKPLNMGVLTSASKDVGPA